MAKTEKVARPKTDRRKTVKTAVTAPSSAPAVVAAVSEGVIAVPEDEIARRAFEVYCARGGQPGSALEDWLQAERELTAAASNGH
jgi:hypothetical protein